MGGEIANRTDFDVVVSERNFTETGLGLVGGRLPTHALKGLVD
jgi:hypothetical protein